MSIDLFNYSQVKIEVKAHRSYIRFQLIGWIDSKSYISIIFSSKGQLEWVTHGKIVTHNIEAARPRKNIIGTGNQTQSLKKRILSSQGQCMEVTSLRKLGQKMGQIYIASLTTANT